MLNSLLTNIFRFIFLILLQGLILNDVHLWDGMAIPYLYILFLIMLPFETPRWLQLILGFVTGLSIDAFTNTLGIHASACLLLTYIRPFLLSWLAPREGYEFGLQPKLQDMGFTWFFYYSFILIFTHHFWLFFIEVASLTDFFQTFLRVILSSLFTLLLTILSQYLIFNKKSFR